MIELMTEDQLPAALTPDDAYRAAFYMIRDYQRRGDADGQVLLLLQYLWTDPARWEDWKTAVREAMEDDGLANPVKDGRYHFDRPEMPLDT
jgi:hypothetical protein